MIIFHFKHFFQKWSQWILLGEEVTLHTVNAIGLWYKKAMLFSFCIFYCNSAWNLWVFLTFALSFSFPKISFHTVECWGNVLLSTFEKGLKLSQQINCSKFLWLNFVSDILFKTEKEERGNMEENIRQICIHLCIVIVIDCHKKIIYIKTHNRIILILVHWN